MDIKNTYLIFEKNQFKNQADICNSLYQAIGNIADIFMKQILKYLGGNF